MPCSRTASVVTGTSLRLNVHLSDYGGEVAYAHFMRLFQTRSFRFAQLHAWLLESVRLLLLFG